MKHIFDKRKSHPLFQIDCLVLKAFCSEKYNENLFQTSMFDENVWMFNSSFKSKFLKVFPLKSN